MKELFKKYGIVIAIVVWVAAALPFIKIFFPSSDSPKTTVSLNQFGTDNKKEELQAFSLINNYGDPFLKKVQVVRYNNEGTQSSIQRTAPPHKPVIKKEQPPVTPWPAVTYSGLIKTKQSNTQLGIFTINGKEELLKPGQQNSDKVMLHKLSADSALLEFNKEKMVVRR